MEAKSPGMKTAGPIMAVLLAVSFSHLLNDTIQALIPAIYPLLKKNFSLTVGQVGLITLTFQLTASILQPFVGLYADRRPLPSRFPKSEEMPALLSAHSSPR